MKKYLIVLSLCIVLSAANCAKQKAETKTPTITFAMQKVYLDHGAEGTRNHRAQVEFNYPLFSGDAAAVAVLNRLIQDVLLSTTFGDSVDLDVKEAAQRFIDEYRYATEDEPELDESWELRVDVAVAFQSDAVVSLRVDEYFFTGGAHGDYSTVFYNVEPNSGRLLRLADFITSGSEERLEQIAERKFRNTYRIADGHSYEDAGYWFENNVFYLTDNMLVLPDGFLFLYNRYEIAPFAAGAVELSLSYDELAEVLVRR